MRLSSQNNQFIFNLPQDFISDRLDQQFQKLMEKNLIPYENVIAYINSTILDITFPSLSFEVAKQNIYHGKNLNWREAGNVVDKFKGELDITFRSVDSHLNYFITMQILIDYYLNKSPYLDIISFQVLDKDGDLIYTILLKDVIYKSLSDLKMSYYATQFEQNTFTMTFFYNFIDIVWELEDDYHSERSILDIPIDEGDPRDVTGLEKEMNKRKILK